LDFLDVTGVCVEEVGGKVVVDWCCAGACVGVVVGEGAGFRVGLEDGVLD